MAIKTNLSIRYYFDELYLEKKLVAAGRASASVASLNLQNLTPAQRVLRIIKELNLLQMKIIAFPRKEYVNYADDLPHLYNYFSGHFYFCRRDEEEKLLEGLVLTETCHLLSALLREAMAQLPLFIWANFMNNEENVVFYELNQQPWGTSTEEYTSMRIWQAHKKQECVDLESDGWKARLIESVKGQSGNREPVQAERDQVVFFYANAPQMTTEDCMNQLSKLRAFSPGSMPENATQWHESFCRFVNGHAMPYALSPGSLQLAFRNIGAGIISDAPICAWSMMKYKKWLDDALQGKMELTALPELSLENRFEKNLTIGPLKCEETISEFNNQNKQKP